MEHVALKDWSATDWTYAGEGGKHALFAFQGDMSDDRTGFLLRVSKSDLAQSEWIVKCEQETSDKGLDGHGDDNCVKFIQEMFACKISKHYIDCPRQVLLPWSFLQSLRRQTVFQHANDIPSRRKHDWTMPKPEMQMNDFPAHASGMLVRNYKHWTSIDDGDCIAVEIKPKAGYTAFSPLVDPQRRCKYLKSRFALLQDLYCQGVIVKQWSSSNSTVTRSNYDPLDLFSNNYARMEAAIRALMDNPQNNLRIWCCGGFMMGVGNCQDGNHDDSTRNWNALADYLHVSPDQAPSALISALTSILLQEPLLQQILAFQRLDVIDGDGAVLLYQRLVHLLDGSNDSAHALLNDYSSKEMKDYHVDDIEYLLSHSPVRSPADMSRINRFCEHTDGFRRMQLATLTDNVRC
ncbi:hypothetical protein MPSEU_001096700 [Mayamaea pseudoterrestris]|nr:hypothetical protein MPSEU_001096700 [Mayamaea pseudoterrestris]